MTIELDIVRLGAQGDGIAETDDGPRYVPFALPGERVRLAGDGMPEVVSSCQPRSRGAAYAVTSAHAAAASRST